MASMEPTFTFFTVGEMFASPASKQALHFKLRFSSMHGCKYVCETSYVLIYLHGCVHAFIENLPTVTRKTARPTSEHFSTCRQSGLATFHTHLPLIFGPLACAFWSWPLGNTLTKTQLPSHSFLRSVLCTPSFDSEPQQSRQINFLSK